MVSGGQGILGRQGTSGGRGKGVRSRSEGHQEQGLGPYAGDEGAQREQAFSQHTHGGHGGSPFPGGGKPKRRL